MVRSSRLLLVEILGTDSVRLRHNLRCEHIVVTAAMEAFDCRLEAVKSSAQRELTDCPQNFDVFWVSIATFKLLLLFFRGIKRPRSRMLKVMFVAVATELSVHVFEAVVTVVLYRFGLVWSIDQDSGCELNFDVSNEIFKNAF